MQETVGCEQLKKKKYKGTGGGVYNLLKLPSYLHPLVEALAEKHHIAGVPGLDQELDGELEYKSDDALAPNGLGIRDVTGEEEEVVLDDSPETFEEGRKKPATTDLALSKPKSIAAKAREALSLFTDKRSLLYDEEIKLARLKQRKVQIEIRVAELKMEEARLLVETAKANLPRSTTNDLPYPQFYSL
ncbi:unnamed protein product [Cylicocyclus nassatus]|uniref:Uncharacterized protein n=1 Tax=Cylicocyclus nassatus TaxID=53992 RepID=A0AA36H960_CYLNA|nr:unnamed protein product [Cylicocyclus nassatus]